MENNLSFVNEEMQDVMGKMPSKLVKYSSGIIFSIIVIAVFISWLIKIPEKVIAEITLDSSLQFDRIISQKNAKIDAILFKTDQFVKKEDYIIVFQNSANYKDVLKLKEQIANLEKTNNFKTFRINDSYKLGEIQSSYSDFKNALLAFELNNYNHKIQNFDDNVYNNDSRELNKKIVFVQDQINNSEKELILKRKELNRYETLFKKGIISQQELDTRTVEYSMFQKSIKNYYTELSNLKSRLVTTVNEDQKIIVNKEKGDVNTNQNVKISISNLKTSISNWEFNNVIKANWSGNLLFKKNLSKGENIQVEEHLFTIHYGAKNYISGASKSNSIHLSKLKNNQIVNLKLYNYPYFNYGSVKGRLKNLSNIIDDEGYVHFDVVFNNELITTYNKKIKFKPGLKGNIEIVVDEKRLIFKLLQFLKPEIN